jgi:hypothetical protein
MRAQLPNVSQTAAWLLGIKLRQNVICRIARFFVSQSLDQMVDLGDREAGELNVEVDAGSVSWNESGRFGNRVEGPR